MAFEIKGFDLEATREGQRRRLEKAREEGGGAWEEGIGVEPSVGELPLLALSLLLLVQEPLLLLDAFLDPL